MLMSHSHHPGLCTQSIFKLPWESQPPLDFVSCHNYGNGNSKVEAKPDEGTADRAKVAKPCEEMEKKKRKFQSLHSRV